MAELRATPTNASSRAPGAVEATSPCALVTGGGSGGHVFPGLAVAHELESRGWRVSWAGGRKGMERRLVTDRGLEYHALEARPLLGRGAVQKGMALANLAVSACRARGLLRRLGAQVVLGTGGFVSAPAAVGARFAGVPLLLLEPNAEPGLANRMLSRLAAEAAIAHDATAARLRCPSKVTGVPVRAEFFAVDPELPPMPPLRILVLGGSQGARQLNELLPAALAGLPDSLGHVEVLHQAGERHLDATAAAYATAGPRVAVASESPGGGESRQGGPATIEVRPTPFLDDVAAAMAESHLVVSRAGAITLAELCAAGRPSLLVPLAIAGGHQRSNAESLARAGAAAVLPTAAEADELGRMLAALLGDRQELAAMAARARSLGRADAAGAIADRVEHWNRAPAPGRGEVS
ncbi:MAG: UDP-N-acetylglucosamine--N-acetylmuramyl-(pentapeptide) pyrophosphoryl-undecaprenol N-acetylglucosamine transferase [Holophagales bacterium]|nr:UDP-N-acetylglucosamine--N-acetylmuramyl-(pentapeptide) pyrophosphoryl-undecaprenol N-acetylglucosamine transferase [Holophagales bacterium]